MYTLISFLAHFGSHHQPARDELLLPGIRIDWELLPYALLYMGGEVPDKIGYPIFCEMALLDKCCCLFAPRTGSVNDFWHRATNAMDLYSR